MPKVTQEAAETGGPLGSMEQLRAIVAAGMPLTEAKMLLDSGYRPDDVLELAEMQAAQRREEAAAAQTTAAKAAADHTERIHNPSNRTYPAISDLSYPEGDRARPRPDLPFECLYNGYPMHKFPETQHWRELELALEIQPGVFKVMRKDYTDMKVTVNVERDANEVITKKDIRFTISREDKDKIPAIAVVLYQIVHAGQKPARTLFLEGMTEWLKITLGDPVAA